MKYTLDNGKSVNIPKSEIEKLMSSLELSEQGAINLWLCDNNLEEDEEQTKLDEKASKVRIDKDIIQKKPKKERKKPEKKVSDAKKQIFSELFEHLKTIYGENVSVLNENKLISLHFNDKTFKIDLVEQRPPKK